MEKAAQTILRGLRICVGPDGLAHHEML